MRHSAVLFAAIISIGLAACGGSQKDQSSDVISESNTEVKVISDTVNNRETQIATKVVSDSSVQNAFRSASQGAPLTSGRVQ